MKQKQYQQPRRRRHHRPRRKRSSNLAGFSLLIIVLAVIVFGASLFFKVHFVEVSGTTICEPQNIKAVSGISDGDFLFYVKKQTAVSAILADQPYVDTVKINSKLPNIIVIEVTECVPLAFFQEQEGFWITDKRGKLLEMTSDKPDLPEITGLTLLRPLTGTSLEVGSDDSHKTAPILELLVLLNELDINIGSINYDTATGISFTYLDRFKVIVGMPELFERKLNYLELYISQLEDNATGTIYLPEEVGGKGRFIPE